jgi:hypothetical protein
MAAIGDCAMVGLLNAVVSRKVHSNLRRRVDNDLAHINVGRLFNREGDSAGNRIRRDRHFLHGSGNLDLHPRIGHGVREVRLNEARRE